ncbi:MAG: helix-turn-helix transcriptional regulator [Planctomycetales bacterium]|nr:helix-turn-helix transcriptional regulator [Planctomycetales bacterium]
MPPAKHPFHEFTLVEAGRGAVHSSHGERELAAGCVVRLPPGAAHRFVDAADDPLTLSVLCVDDRSCAAPEGVARLWRDLLGGWTAGSVVQFANSYELTAYRRVFRQLIMELGRDLPGRAAMVHACAVQLLTGLHRLTVRRHETPAAGEPRDFAASLALIEDRFIEPLKIEDLAQRAGMSYRSFTAHFRRKTGLTVTQYVTRLRLQLARRRMQETGNIVGAALEAGFRDVSHFYRMFKRESGVTPQEFLRNGRPRGDAPPRC